MFTDIVNSTKLKGLMPGETSTDRQEALHDDIKGPHAHIIHECVRKRKGVIVEGTGDGYFIAFGDAERAVLCGVEIQERLAQAAIVTPVGPLQIRIGLNGGPATPKPSGYTSSAADKAARVQSAAAPGQVFLSKSTAELVRDQIKNVGLCSAGEHALKGIGREELFRAGRPGDLSVSTADPAHPAPTPAPARSLRVLVVGSLNSPKRKSERQQFTTACRHLGAALARRGLTIVVSSLHPNTADVPILQGANDARAGQGRLPVVLLPPTQPRANDPLYPGNEQEFQASYPNLTMTLEMLAGGWKEIRAAQAREADVVVLLGGREGTRQVAWAAKQHGVPIVPVPVFGRAAKDLWALERAEHVGAKHFETAEAFSKLYDKFNAEQIAELALSLAQRRHPIHPTTPAALAQHTQTFHPIAHPSSMSTPATKCKLLFLAANPTGTTQLALDEESREIDQKIRASEHRDALELIAKFAIRPDDLLQHLNQHRPHIVHFSGHGTATEEIVLLDKDRNAKPVSAAALKQLFKALKDNIRVVVLNACFSRPQAKAITEHIDCAIGMQRAIGDAAAITFAASFYRAIGFGRSVKEAFDQGVLSLMLEGIPEERTPKLLTRDGVDPATIYLVGLNPR